MAAPSASGSRSSGPIARPRAMGCLDAGTLFSPAGERFGLVLVLPRPNDTVSYVPHLERLGSQTLLEWWADAIRREQNDLPLYVALPPLIDGPRLRDVLRRARVTAVETSAANEIDALHELTHSAPIDHVIVAGLGLAIGARGRLERTVRHHLTHQNTYTWVLGEPSGGAPDIFARCLIEQIAALHLPEMPRRAAEAVRTLIHWNGKSALLPFQIRAIPYKAELGSDTASRPQSVSINSAHDVRILRRLIAEGLTGTDGAYPRWKDILIEDRHQRAKALARCAGTGSATRRGRRILFLSNDSGLGGAERVLVDAIGSMSSRLETFALVSLRGEFTRQLKQVCSRVWAPNLMLGVDTIDNYLYVSRVLARTRPDAVHFNGLVGSPALFATVARGIPIIQHLHVATLSSYLHQIQYATAIVAVSDYVCARARCLDIDIRDIVVIRNGVDADRFAVLPERTVARERLGLSPHGMVATVLARIEPQKRQDLVLSAAGRAWRSGTEVTVVLAGQCNTAPEYYGELRKLAELLQITRFVHYVAHQREVRDVLAASDCVILVSEQEGLPISVLEAMAAGVPVIVARSGGSTEVVRHLETGLVVPPGDADALARAIAQLSNDAGFAERLGSAGRAAVRRTHSIRDMARRFEALLEDVASGHQYPRLVAGHHLRYGRP